MITQNIIRLVFGILTLFSILDKIDISSDAKVVAIGQLGALKHSNSVDRIENILKFRGGEAIVLKKNNKKKKSKLAPIKEVLDQIAPATRGYLILCTICTLIHVIGTNAFTYEDVYIYIDACIFIYIYI
jgi:hypothetical protein